MKISLTRNTFPRRILAFSAFLAMGGIFPNEMLGENDPILSLDDCDFIQRFDLENQTNFATNFSTMVHRRDGEEDCLTCTYPLTKRRLDIQFSVFRAGNLESAEGLVAGMSQAIDLIETETELDASFVRLEEVNLEEGGTFIFFLVDGDSRPAIENFFSGLPNFNQIIERVTRPETTCFIASPLWTRNVESGYVFIDVENHNTPEEVSSCAREEVFNGMGIWSDPIGQETLFSNPQWLGDALPEPYFRSYGVRDHLVMRLFYREDFENGQSYDETFTDVSRIVFENCPQ